MENQNKQGMESNFVPYELAVKLKELGFDKDCFKVKVLGKEQYDYTQSDYADFPEQREKEVLIPLWQQAFDWFREKHNKHVVIYKIENEDKSIVWDWDIVAGNDEDEEEFDLPYSDTYELARTACLEKLIELTLNTQHHERRSEK